MSDFSQLLSCHIHSKDIKTYALAQYCGLDRSNMYKIINGKRKPSSRELVLKICKFMQLSHAEQKEMEQAYEITLIGHDTYYRRKAVIDFFNNFRLSKLNLPVLSELNTEILFEKGSVTLNTMAEVNRSLLYIISLEVKKSNGTIDLLVLLLRIMTAHRLRSGISSVSITVPQNPSPIQTIICTVWKRFFRCIVTWINITAFIIMTILILNAVNLLYFLMSSLPVSLPVC